MSENKETAHNQPEEISRSSRFKPYIIPIIMTVIILTVIAIRFAEPIVDGDLFFHMAYGKYFIENKTLIPDHAIYSWTPADNTYIYCAWISEIIFYLLFKIGGYTAIYILRYAFILITVVLILLYAKRLNIIKNPVIYLYILIFILTSMVGTYHKPEIFSFVLFSVVSWLYFNIKLDFSEGKNTWWKFYIFPAIMLFWVNTHGVFMWGMILLGLIGAGEIINYFIYRPKHKKKSKENTNYKGIPLKHLILSLFLCFIAIFITPYGFNYIFTLISMGERQLEIKTNLAYSSIFETGAGLFHYVEFLICMLIIAIVTFYPTFKSKKPDMSLIIINIIFGYLFTIYLRTTFYWPPVFIYTILYLQKDWNWNIGRKWVKGLNTILLVLFLFWCGRAVTDSLFIPFINLWCGFGVSYQNPVVETAFLRAYNPGTRLLNDYDTGGYLIYYLYPQYKVAIDPRGFPYSKWYNEYVSFLYGQTFDEFMAKYPSDVAMISLRYDRCIQNFFNSPYWKIAYWGPVAVIFVRSDIILPSDAKNFIPERFDSIQNFQKLVEIFSFSNTINDDKTGLHVINVGKKQFNIYPAHIKGIRNLSLLKNTMKDYFKLHDYEKSLKGITECKKLGVWNKYILSRVYRWESLNLVSKGEMDKALLYENAIIKCDPTDISAVFNAGMMEYIIEQKNGTNNKKWKTNLELFIKTLPQHVHGKLVRDILDGKKKDPIVMTYPSQPAVKINI